MKIGSCQDINIYFFPFGTLHISLYWFWPEAMHGNFAVGDYVKGSLYEFGKSGGLLLDLWLLLYNNLIQLETSFGLSISFSGTVSSFPSPRPSCPDFPGSLYLHFSQRVLMSPSSPVVHSSFVFFLDLILLAFIWSPFSSFVFSIEFCLHQCCLPWLPFVSVP